MYQDEHIIQRPNKKPQTKKTLITLSIILNITLAVGTFWLYNQNNTLSQEVTEYTQTLTTFSEKMANYQQQLNMTRTQLLYYQGIANQLSSISDTGEDSPGIIGQATVPIVSVKTVQNMFSIGYEGEIMQAKVELLHGEGRVLVDTQIINGADIQTSLRTAASIASQLTGASLSGTDIILTIDGGTDIEMVDGASAGAALTIAIYSAITGQTPLSNVYMTGTIAADGTVGVIGGLQYKAQAVAEAGGTKFLVPSGQSTIVVYEPVTKTIGRQTYTFYQAVNVDLETYLAENGYNVEVVEISNITDATQYFFQT